MPWLHWPRDEPRQTFPTCLTCSLNLAEAGFILIDIRESGLTGLKCLWRGSTGSVTVSVQVDIRPAEYAAQLKTIDKITTSQYSFVIQEQIVLFPRKMNKTD